MLSDYIVGGRIGEGGMAEVFRGFIKKGPKEGVPVAIKKMRQELQRDAQSVEFFLSEADLTQQLRHPNIVEVLEAGISGDGIYIVMEYIDGRDLGQIMRRCAEKQIKLPIDFVCFVIETVASALHHAHTATGPDGRPLNLVHCDMTPSNVFISTVGEIKLGDFGVAMATGYGHLRTDLVAGKPQFFAPEQIMGEALSPATDVFALGAIFYELLTNRPCFSGTTVQDIWENIVDGKSGNVRKHRADIAEPIAAVLERALLSRRSPDDRGTQGLGKLMGKLRSGETRYQSAKELIDDLSPLYDHSIGTPLAIASVVRNLFRGESRG